MAAQKTRTPAKKQSKPSAQKKSSATKKAATTRAKSGVAVKAKTGKAVSKAVSGPAKTASAKKKVAAKIPAKSKTAATRKAKKPATAGEKVRRPLKTAPQVKGKKASAKHTRTDLAKVSSQEAPSVGRLQDLRRMLISKRDGILQEAKQEIAKYISGENRQLVDTAIDEGDWATVDISEDISLRRLGAQRQLLQDIEECLRKIQEGTYGICEECGEEISAKRLSVIPMATLCIDCKENREKMAVVEHGAEM